MSTIVTMPESGMRLSCITATAPQDADVVTVEKSDTAPRSNRASFPSQLKPSAPMACKSGFPVDSV